VRLHELADLLIRWIHVFAGILWIGNSMLFNWLDRNLVRTPEEEGDPKRMGRIWMVHSGGFYEVEKKLLAPGQMPAELHWFKWQNGITWLSGISLLVVVYYLNGGAFLVDPAVKALSAPQATLLGVGVVVVSWLIYDVSWRTLGRFPVWPTALTLAVLVGSSWVLTQTLSGRAAFIHVGVVIGTIMTGNVWFVILPAQRELLAATREGREQDPSFGLKAKLRSIHNNYLTLPLLFLMVSNHFPATWSTSRRWWLLVVLVAAGAGVRWGMNLRYTAKPWLPVAAGSAILGVGGLLGLTWSARPAASPGGEAVAFETVERIVGVRCRSCHSAKPTDPLSVATLGVLLDSPEQIRAHAPRIRARVVELRTMPFLNKTGMTDDERETIGRWIDQGADTTARSD